MSKTIEAPNALASKICSSVEMKSFLSVGIATPVLTVSKSSILPLKPLSSVRTEIAEAPACSYVLARASGSLISAISPLDGEALLISAMTESSLSLKNESASKGVWSFARAVSSPIGSESLLFADCSKEFLYKPLRSSVFGLCAIAHLSQNIANNNTGQCNACTRPDH